MRFRFLGTPGFEALAASLIVFPEVWADFSGYQTWDPGGYVDTVEDCPTSAPGRTVAAVIERNLLYTAPDHIDRRIDTLLLAQLTQLQNLVDAHRAKAKQPAEAAKRALLDEWEAAIAGPSTSSASANI